MNFFSKLRLPYREETAFGLLALAVFIVPLIFSEYSYENFESIKFALFLLCVGAAALVFARQVGRSEIARSRSPEINSAATKQSLRQDEIAADLKPKPFKSSQFPDEDQMQKASPGKEAVKYHKVFFWISGLFLSWSVLATIFSVDHLYSVFGFYYRFTNGLVFLTAFTLFLFLILQLADRPRLEYLLKILVLDGFVVALVSFAEGFNYIIYGGSEVPGFFRGPSLLGNTNYSALFLAAVFPLTIYFFLNTKNFWAKIYYSVSAFWIALAIFILASRAAILGLIAGIIVALLLLLIYRFPKKVLFGLLGLAAVLWLMGQVSVDVSRPSAVSSIVTSVDDNTTLRLMAGLISVEDIIKRPILGTGLGTYSLTFEHSRPASMAGQIGLFDDAHNLFLQLGVTGGIPLAVLFLAIALLPVWYGLVDLRREKNYLTVFLISSMIVLLIGVNFNPVPIPIYLFIAVLSAGLLLSRTKIKEIDWQIKWRWILGILGAVLCAIGLVSAVSEHLLGIAIRLYANQDYRGSYRLATAAYDLNPTNELFLEYKIYSEIYLGVNRSTVVTDINKMENMHPAEAGETSAAADLYYTRYQYTGQKQDLQAAAASMQQSLVSDPLYSERYGQLAIYQYQLGQLPQAKASDLKLLSMENDIFSSWVLLAKLYQLDNNRIAAISALDKAYSLNQSLQLKYILEIAKNQPDIRKVPIQLGFPGEQ